MTDETNAEAPHRTRAVLAAALLLLLALAAHAGRLAELPAAARIPGIGLIGPGNIGKLRGLPLDAAGLPPLHSEALAGPALAGAPLSYEPFFVAAAAGFRGGTAQGAAGDAALLREALRRNQRAREAHYLLLRNAVGAGNIKEAIGEIAILTRLTNGATDKMMAAVGTSVTTERQADDAIAGLASYPELLGPFLIGYAQGAKPAALSVHLVTHLPRAALADPNVRNVAVSLLVSAQAFGEARSLWGAAAGKAALINNPDFAKTTARPPFDWTLVEDSTGVAEHAPQGGLSVDYYGREPGPIASQLLTLAPGRYKARLQYRTDGGSPGALGLGMRCAGGDTTLFMQPLTGKIGTVQILTVRFVVPAHGCAGQFVSIAGRIQESRDPQQALIRRLDLLQETAQ
ncbi:MAG: hypothetical protein ABIU18_06340 [Novosphingobium sp.]